MTAFIGVLISWLMLARNIDFASVADSASRVASRSSAVRSMTVCSSVARPASSSRFRSPSSARSSSTGRSSTKAASATNCSSVRPQPRGSRSMNRAPSSATRPGCPPTSSQVARRRPSPCIFDRAHDEKEAAARTAAVRSPWACRSPFRSRSLTAARASPINASCGSGTAASSLSSSARCAVRLFIASPRGGGRGALWRRGFRRRPRS